MKGIVAFFQDNAMFYKDITQWLRNKTFGSLFFGLLLIAEAISLLIIAGSDDIGQPGVTMFYLLYSVLMVYALIIAFLGNGITSREFMNRTFELYELSGMSLERMIGGKLISMIYQFAFGFFCLVPFMFFSYFLGGLDFFEMLMGTLVAWLLAVPLYLISLTGALVGRFKQVALLTRLASGFGLAVLVMFIMGSFFSNSPIVREMIKGISEVLKKILDGDFQALCVTISVVVIYVLLNLLLFYLCCNSISRETDSREIAIKGILTMLILAWMGFFGVMISVSGYGDNVMQIMIMPIFLSLLALGLVSYYNRLSVPPIVRRRYLDAGPLRRLIYWLFQPGMRGGLRTILFLIVMVALVSTAIVSTSPFSHSGSTSEITKDWWYSLSLLCQIPWFLTVPYLLYIRGRDLRYNYPGQRALVMATWVILGILVTIFLAWKRSGIYNSSTYGGSLLDPLICVMLSPLSSISIMGSNNTGTLEAAPYMRYFFGAIGVILMLAHLYSLMREDARLSIEAEHASQEGTVIEENSTAPEKAEG